MERAELSWVGSLLLSVWSDCGGASQRDLIDRSIMKRIDLLADSLSMSCTLAVTFVLDAALGTGSDVDVASGTDSDAASLSTTTFQICKIVVLVLSRRLARSSPL